MLVFKKSCIAYYVGTLCLLSIFAYATGLKSSIKSSGERIARTSMMMQMDTCANKRIPKLRLISALRGGGPCSGSECKYVPALAWLEKYSLAQQTGFGFFSVVFVVVAEVELLGFLAKNKYLETTVTRKLTHILAGATTFSLFALFPRGHSWPGRLLVAGFLCLFMAAFASIAHMTDADMARLPPLIRERVERLVSNTCRSGRRQELMAGPFFYCVTVAQLTVLLWSSPASMLAFSALFLGDGLADPVGRRLAGTRPWLQYRAHPGFGPKSLPGSAAFFLCSLGGAWAWSRFFGWAGHLPEGFSHQAFLRAAVAVSAVATLAEAVSPPQVDNLLIVFASLAAAFALDARAPRPFLLTTRG